MKKEYITPSTVLELPELNTLCIGVEGSTSASSGNLAKEERELEEEEEEMKNPPTSLFN